MRKRHARNRRALAMLPAARVLRLASFLALLAVVLVPAGARAGEGWTRYGGLILHSWHLGSDALNDNTPGVLIGGRRPVGWPGAEIFVEGGVFRNSYDETAPILTFGATGRVARLGPAELRLGGFAGLAYYHDLAPRLRDRGIPTLGPVIPLVGLSAILRQGPVDLRLVTVPPADDVDAIFNLSVAFRF